MAPVPGEQPVDLGVEQAHGHIRQDVGVGPDGLIQAEQPGSGLAMRTQTYLVETWGE